MKPTSNKRDSAVIVYDAGCIQQPDPQLFDPVWWQARGAVAGEAIGRGSALFLETPFGEAVLRRYLRGGFPARFNRDKYLFTGWERSRPVAEFNALVELSAAGLPVPRPLAAMTRRRWPYYTGGLLTRRIMDSLPAADLMAEQSGRPEFWVLIGACIRRFHEHGVVHADLNARNILVDLDDRIYLIDFDRARTGGGRKKDFEANLSRLRRSFDKLWPHALRDRLDGCWNSLLAGYRSGGGPA